MPESIFKRMSDYLQDEAALLRADAHSASIFPNTSDIGVIRECAYKNFLLKHLPHKCLTSLGGFLFGSDGTESKQIDIIISTDTSPKYILHTKSFSPVEGCLGVVSVKSTLNKDELEDCLINISSIPLNDPIAQRMIPTFHNSCIDTGGNWYKDWPFKVIYATDGSSAETILSHLNKFYEEHPEIPYYRMPNLIHILGKYIIVRNEKGMAMIDGEHKFSIIINNNIDVQALSWVINTLQQRALMSTYIIYSYDWLHDRIIHVNKSE